MWKPEINKVIKQTTSPESAKLPPNKQNPAPLHGKRKKTREQGRGEVKGKMVKGRRKKTNQIRSGPAEVVE